VLKKRNLTVVLFIAELVDIVKNRIHELPSLGSSTEELDRFAKRLVEIIQGAVKIAGRKPSRFRLNAWWNDDCANAVKSYKKATRNAACRGNKVAARWHFRRIIRRAKQ
jgi:hypothetical protein